MSSPTASSSTVSSSLKPQFIKLSDKFLQVSLREQLLVLACGCIVVLMLAYNLLLEPLLTESEKLQKQTASMPKELASLTDQVAQLTRKLQEDPNDVVLEKIEKLEGQINNLVQQLVEQTKKLVPANKMASMLENVLADSKGLTLIELQSIAPVAVLFDPENANEAGLYRHGVTLVFEGSYFNIQKYLEKLESMPWQFYWNKFDYAVSDYPTASVELEIYTLSTNKAFIGI